MDGAQCEQGNQDLKTNTLRAIWDKDGNLPKLADIIREPDGPPDPLFGGNLSAEYKSGKSLVAMFRGLNQVVDRGATPTSGTKKLFDDFWHYWFRNPEISGPKASKVWDGLYNEKVYVTPEYSKGGYWLKNFEVLPGRLKKLQNECGGVLGKRLSWRNTHCS